MKGLVTIAVLAGIVMSAPIWRGAGHPRTEGISFWKLLRDSTQTLKDSPFGHPHVSYDEAVQLAQEAYREHCMSGT
jgi:hypothetical protein